MFGSDELNVTGRRYVQRGVPDVTRFPHSTRARMVGWRNMKVSNAPVSMRRVPYGLKAQLDPTPVLRNEGGSPVFGLGSEAAGPSILDSATGAWKGIKDIFSSGSFDKMEEMVSNFADGQSEGNKETIEKNKKRIEDMMKDDPTRMPDGSSDDSGGGILDKAKSLLRNGDSRSDKKPSFFSTPAGIAVIAGGGLVLLLGAYVLLKK